MADNTVISQGTGGDTIRTDEISGVKWPCEKVAYGADGSATLVDASNPLPTYPAPAGAFDHGGNADVDASAEQITASSIPATRGVLVLAHDDNTGYVYLGNSDVTADGTDATDGYPLGPGESVFLPVSNANLVYARGSAANQKLFFLVV